MKSVRLPAAETLEELHAQRLELLEAMLNSGSKIAIPAAVYYCSKHDLVVPQWLVGAAAKQYGELLRKDGQRDYRNALSLLQLDMDLRKKFNLGVDSAQCEILMALIAAELNPTGTAATRFLAEAEKIIDKNQSAYDQACWNRAHAKTRYLRATAENDLGATHVRKEIIARLTKSIHWFEDADRKIEKIDTERKLELFKIRGKVW